MALTWRRRCPSPRVPELDPPEAYAAWAPCYPPRAHNRLMELEEGAVVRRLPDLRGLTALDLACGSGRYTRILRRLGAEVVVGIDRSPEMLARARGVVSRAVRGDLRALPLRDGSIDVAVCGLAVGDVRELDRVLEGVARVLRRGGVIVYSDLHPRGAAAGWQRTFEAGGRRLAVRHHRHAIDAHLAACRAAGLAIECVDEPTLDVEHEYRDWPVALVITARKVP